MIAMHRILGLVVMCAAIVIGCAEQSAGQPSVAGAASDAPQSAVASVGPSSPPASPIAVVEPQRPVEFTGRLECGPPVSPEREGVAETVAVSDDGMVLSRYRRGAWNQTVTMSDPRLEGAVYHTFEGGDYRLPAAETGPGMWAATRHIVNDQGSWEADAYGGTFADGTAIGGDAPEVWIGQAAYTGLVAIMEMSIVEGTCDATIRGVLFAGAPVAEPYRPG